MRLWFDSSRVDTLARDILHFQQNQKILHEESDLSGQVRKINKFTDCFGFHLSYQWTLDYQSIQTQQLIFIQTNH